MSDLSMYQEHIGGPLLHDSHVWDFYWYNLCISMDAEESVS